MMQIGRDAGDQHGGIQHRRQRARAAPGDQHDDGDGEKQRGEFHGRSPDATRSFYTDSLPALYPAARAPILRFNCNNTADEKPRRTDRASSSIRGASTAVGFLARCSAASVTPVELL